MALNTEHEQYSNCILHFRCALFGNHCLRGSYIEGKKCELATKFSDRQPKRGVHPNPLEPPLRTGLQVMLLLLKFVSRAQSTPLKAGHIVAKPGASNSD